MLLLRTLCASIVALMVLVLFLFLFLFLASQFPCAETSVGLGGEKLELEDVLVLMLSSATRVASELMLDLNLDSNDHFDVPGESTVLCREVFCVELPSKSSLLILREDA